MLYKYRYVFIDISSPFFIIIIIIIIVLWSHCRNNYRHFTMKGGTKNYLDKINDTPPVY